MLTEVFCALQEKNCCYKTAGGDFCQKAENSLENSKVMNVKRRLTYVMSSDTRMKSQYTTTALPFPFTNSLGGLNFWSILNFILVALCEHKLRRSKCKIFQTEAVHRNHTVKKSVVGVYEEHYLDIL